MNNQKIILKSDKSIYQISKDLIKLIYNDDIDNIIFNDGDITNLKRDNIKFKKKNQLDRTILYIKL